MPLTLLDDADFGMLFALSGRTGFASGWTPPDLVNELGGTEAEHRARLADLEARGLAVRDERGFGASAAGQALIADSFRELRAGELVPLPAGVETLGAVAQALEERARELAQLEADGWQLVSEVDEGTLWLTRTSENLRLPAVKAGGRRDRLSPLAARS